ncbi:hypothetical protein B0H14DRAFT_2584640 [Mycena olivaceomarginata]|nr:hypothetical protein B0H14DRAFT_2584640 [Mycena olivaceomarginata]
MGLTSLTTLRRKTTIRPLLPSAGRPRIEEIEYIIDSCLDATPKSSPSSHKRARYDDPHKQSCGNMSAAWVETAAGPANWGRPQCFMQGGKGWKRPPGWRGHPLPLWERSCKLENGAEHAAIDNCDQEQVETKEHTALIVSRPMVKPGAGRLGDDDITADKDVKHALKCLRNLTMRDAGIKIRGFRITAAITKEHLGRNDFFERTS